MASAWSDGALAAWQVGSVAEAREAIRAGAVTRIEPAADVIRELATGAVARLRGAPPGQDSD
ncbi:hypothetical protein [Streptomyces niphimycinicus]|uniref:hypothetical protein n=1 Tax=Streptomyces niphimycinicus TaxID=2842201 RepID=UPI00209B14ED|nr:hypothetical protein [Streptomyces niphimycinicus]